MAPNREQFQPREFLGFALRFYRSRAHTSIALVVDPTMERGVMATIYRLACAMGTAELFDDYQLALKWLMRCEFAARGPALQHDPASPLTGAAKFHR
tara:strand:+ start:44 stop:334 length:291 start_codon:yes stop_codon:yes gene_type:complete